VPAEQARCFFGRNHTDRKNPSRDNCLKGIFLEKTNNSESEKKALPSMLHRLRGFFSLMLEKQ
jgi:hypothetical protein